MRLRYYAPLVAALTVATFSAPTAGQQGQNWGRTTAEVSTAALTADLSLTSMSLQSQGDKTTSEQPVATAEQSPPSPFNFGMEYSLYSDYIFRGINFSEFSRESRERLNHQLSVDVGVDLGLLFERDAGSLGTLNFNTWFEWFAAQKKIDPVAGGQNLQEVDYLIAWSYDLDQIATALTLGYVFFSFSNAKVANTQEWNVTLEHNDAWMWKWLWPENEDGILNPSFYYSMDVVAAPRGSWMELGISHEFNIAENLTLTPSTIAAIDHRYLDPILGTGRTGSTRLAYVQYGLNIGYDFSAALNLPNRIGSWSASGFLYFNDALGNPEDRGTIKDEFYGGVSIGVSF